MDDVVAGMAEYVDPGAAELRVGATCIDLPSRNQLVASTSLPNWSTRRARVLGATRIDAMVDLDNAAAIGFWEDGNGATRC